MIKSFTSPTQKQVQILHRSKDPAAIATIDRPIEISRSQATTKLQPSIDAKGIDIGNAIDSSNCKQR